MLREHVRVGVDVERLVLRPLRDAETAARVDLPDLVAGVEHAPGHLGDAFDRDLEPREPVGQEPVADVDVHGVDREPVFGGEGERVVELLGQDAELRRRRPRVERLAFGRGQAAPRGAGARVHADPHRGARRAASPPLELRAQVEVHVDAALDQRVDVGCRQVRPGEADLVRPTSRSRARAEPRPASTRRSPPSPGRARTRAPPAPAGP